MTNISKNIHLTAIFSSLLLWTFLSHQQVVIATELPLIVVTGTRTAQTANQSLVPVSVITRRDIERLQLRTVDEALTMVPSISISKSGGRGTLTSIFMRGTESDHVLVLIDGIKVGSATAGTTALQNIPTDQVERIEIVRGPKSSLYGSEAIGGVIQIFTRRGRGKFKPTFSINGGSYNTYATSVGFAGGQQGFWTNIQARYESTDGINACRGSFSQGCFTIEPDKDGYENTSVSFRAGYQFKNQGKIDVYSLFSKGKTQFDGSLQNEGKLLQRVVGTLLSINPSSFWQTTLNAGRSTDNTENFLNGTPAGHFNTQRDTMTFQNDFTLGNRQLLSVGADFLKDRVSSNNAFVVTSRDNRGYFLQYQGGVSKHNFQLAIRNDENEQFGNSTTGDLAWGIDFSNRYRLTFSYGTAFKAPSFNDLYFPGFNNPTLNPEKAQSQEIGVKGRMAKIDYSVQLFQTNIKELITFDSAMNKPINIDEARIVGTELILSTHVRGWTVNTNLSLLKPESRSNDGNQGNILPRRAEQILQLETYYQLGKFQLGSVLFAQGRRYERIDNNLKLPGYAIMGFYANVQFYKSWTLQAKVNNLFDKKYETIAFYNQPGINFLMTLRYQPR